MLAVFLCLFPHQSLDTFLEEIPLKNIVYLHSHMQVRFRGHLCGIYSFLRLLHGFWRLSQLTGCKLHYLATLLLMSPTPPRISLYRFYAPSSPSVYSVQLVRSCFVGV